MNASASEAAATPAAVLRDASLSYDGVRVAASGINFTLNPGDALALIGPNGAGKSTVLKALLGLVRVTAGSVEVFGGTVQRGRARVGYLPQHAELDPNFPVSLREVVMMGRFRRLGPFRWPGRADREAVRAAIERVGLSDRASRQFGDLSGGQRQRTLLARALVSGPRMLLLDEPFNGLDTHNRIQLMRTLRELRADGIAIVVSTHDLELATQVCSHALLVNREQVAFGTVDDVLTNEQIVHTFGESHDHLDTHDDSLAHPHPVPTRDESGPLP